MKTSLSANLPRRSRRHITLLVALGALGMLGAAAGLTGCNDKSESSDKTVTPQASSPRPATPPSSPSGEVASTDDGLLLNDDPNTNGHEEGSAKDPTRSASSMTSVNFDPSQWIASIDYTDLDLPAVDQTKASRTEAAIEKEVRAPVVIQPEFLEMVADMEWRAAEAARNAAQAKVKVEAKVDAKIESMTSKAESSPAISSLSNASSLPPVAKLPRKLAPQFGMMTVKVYRLASKSRLPDLSKAASVNAAIHSPTTKLVTANAICANPEEREEGAKTLSYTDAARARRALNVEYQVLGATYYAQTSPGLIPSKTPGGASKVRISDDYGAEVASIDATTAGTVYALVKQHKPTDPRLLVAVKFGPAYSGEIDPKWMDTKLAYFADANDGLVTIARKACDSP